MAILCLTGWALLAPYQPEAGRQGCTLLAGKMGGVEVFSGLSLVHGFVISPPSRRLQLERSLF